MLCGDVDKWIQDGVESNDSCRSPPERGPDSPPVLRVPGRAAPGRAWGPDGPRRGLGSGALRGEARTLGLFTASSPPWPPSPPLGAAEPSAQAVEGASQTPAASLREVCPAHGTPGGGVESPCTLASSGSRLGVGSVQASHAPLDCPLWARTSTRGGAGAGGWARGKVG
ncbi:hypothetical protein DBR06_SOUSAS2010008, partial [Sousa chinensis]